jgi:hypothetical protein
VVLLEAALWLLLPAAPSLLPVPVPSNATAWTVGTAGMVTTAAKETAVAVAVVVEAAAAESLPLSIELALQTLAQ